MKIALFVPSWPPGYAPNGIVTYASQLVPALRKLGHEPFVLTTPRVGHRDTHVINIGQFARPPTLWNRAIYRLAPHRAAYKAGADQITAAIRHMISRYAIEVCEIEDSFGWNYDVACLNALPVVVRLHGPWFLNGRFEGRARPSASDLDRETREGKGIANAHFVTSPSIEVLRSTEDHYGYRLRASQVIPNPFGAVPDSETWRPNDCERNSLLFVGRSDTRKGGDVVLRVFAELAPSYPSLRLTFVGPDRGVAGPDGSTWPLDRYFKWVVPIPYQSRVDFRGQMEHTSIAALRRSHFITIIPSRYEIMPYSVLEAMSFGCPIVATSVGGIPELIKDRRNGLLVKPENVMAMADACRTLLDDRVLAVGLGHQAWQDCGDLYAPEKIAERTVAVYREAIERFKSRCCPRPRVRAR